MLRSIIVCVLVAISVTGCREEASSSSEERDTSTLTAAELGWIRAYSSWTFDFYEDEPDVGPEDVVACRADVERIGPSPTPRLQEAADGLPAICPLVRSVGSMRRAQDEIARIDDLLLPYMRTEQPLPLTRGVTDWSRADVALSEIASDVMREPVEVRCWDDEDWLRVVVEDNAWNDDSADPDALVGWSDDSDYRIHLVLGMCNTITSAAKSDVASWSRADRIDAIDAIETLAHEIQHFLASDASEAVTECRAIRSLPRFAQRLGVGEADARDLTELYRTEVYPDLDSEYTAGGCPRTG